MNSDQPQFVRTEIADLGGVTDFMRRENSEESVSEEYLRWWYFRNPSNSFSFWHCLANGKIVGMATTNNFRLQTAAGEKTAAMPQKVLTSAEMRGRGLFGKLYRQTEEDNLAAGVDCFLTVTNEMSTPIFLNKFGYRRGICPDVITLLPGLRSLIAGKQYEPAASESITGLQAVQSNAIIKSSEHFRWRYSAAQEQKIVILQVADDHESPAGYVFLKKLYKRRLPLYALLDLLILQPSRIELLLREALKYALRNLSLGLIALDCEDLSAHWQKFAHRRVKNRFNFLVKGRSPEETNELAETKFNLSFGDLDFI